MNRSEMSVSSIDACIFGFGLWLVCALRFYFIFCSNLPQHFCFCDGKINEFVNFVRCMRERQSREERTSEKMRWISYILTSGRCSPWKNISVSHTQHRHPTFSFPNRLWILNCELWTSQNGCRTPVLRILYLCARPTTKWIYFIVVATARRE